MKIKYLCIICLALLLKTSFVFAELKTISNAITSGGGQSHSESFQQFCVIGETIIKDKFAAATYKGSMGHIYQKRSKQTFTINGMIAYQGSQFGNLYIDACAIPDTNCLSPTGISQDWSSYDSIKPYTMALLKNETYLISAYIDSNYNGVCDESEPKGSYTSSINSSIVDCNFALQEQKNNVILSVNDVEASPGEQKKPLSIYLDNLTENNTSISSLQLKLKYDGSIGIHAIEHALTPRTTEFMSTFQVTENGSESEINILLYNMSGKEISPGIEPIMNILFNVDENATEESVSTIQIVECILSNSQAQEIPAIFSDTGLFSIISNIPGDINNDKSINIIDLQVLINVIIGKEQNQLFVQWADLNNDGSCNIIDLQQIINMIIGHRSKRSRTLRDSNNSNSYILPDLKLENDQTGTFGLALNNSDSVASGQVKLKYDSTIGLNITGVNLTERTNGYSSPTFQKNDENPEAVEILVLFYSMGTSIQPGSGNILEFTYQTGSNGEGTSSIDFVETLLVDSNANTLQVNAQNGSASFNTTSPILSVHQNSIDVSAAKGNASFNISNTGGGNLNWEVTNDAAWVDIVQGMKGTNSGQVTFFYHRNTESDRVAKFVITASGAENSPQYIEINQRANAAPMISYISDQGGQKNTPSNPVSFVVNDAESDQITITAESLNQDIVTEDNIVITSNGNNYTLLITPTYDQSGIADIVIKANDGITETEQTFSYVVDNLLLKIDSYLTALPGTSISVPIALLNSNHTPIEGFDIKILYDINVLSLDQSSSKGAVLEGGVLYDNNYGIEVGSQVPGVLILTIAAKSNLFHYDGVIGYLNFIVVGDKGDSTSLDFEYASINDKEVQTENGLFRVNSPPTVSNINNAIMNMNENLTLPFSVSDEFTDAMYLIASAKSSEQSILVDNQLTIKGTGNNRLLTIVPVENATGTVEIVISVSDGNATTEERLDLFINSFPIANAQTYSTNEDERISITLNASDSDGQSLTYTILGLPKNGTLTGIPPHIIYQPDKNYFGSDKISFTVNDGYTNALLPAEISLSVVPVNDEPQISVLSDQVLNRSIASNPISITVSDIDTPIEELQLTWESSEKELINLVMFSGFGQNRTATIIPSEGKHGTSTIDIVVSDGIDSVKSEFNVTVNNILLSLPQESYGYLGSSSVIPVSFTSDIPVNTIELIFQSEANLFNDLSASLVGSMMNDQEYSLITKQSNIGELTVKITRTEGVLPFTGSGLLANILFQLNDNKSLLNKTSDIRISNALVNGSEIDSISGTFTTIGYTISGEISYYSGEGIPVSDVSLFLSGAGSYSTVSDSNGEYTFSGIPYGEYSLVAKKTNETHGIGATDASKIFRSIPGLVPLSCEQLIAADVNINTKVTSIDASRTFRYPAKYIEYLNDRHIDFVFLNERIENCDEWPPITYETGQNFLLDENRKDNNLIMIRLGDVSGNWGDKNLNQKRQFRNRTKTILVNDDLISVPIKTSTETTIEGLDIQLNFDPMILSFVDATLAQTIFEYQEYGIFSSSKVPGKVIIQIFAKNSVLHEKGNLVWVTFKIKKLQNTDLSIDKLICNDQSFSGGFENDNSIYDRLRLSIQEHPDL
ncbi:secreted protein containing Cellulosome anchoring protein, cohesin region domain protein [Candidatus Magnetomorum sp. HK-1]|nr:secreted protein containing Cellulosome anchoring protein, cohesin region domain protein [Candidatus Magnetomorum sp. HK-1]